MAQRTRNMYYNDGNTARKLDAYDQRQAMPRRHIEEVPDYEREIKAKPKRKLSAKADRALAFNLRYTAFVTASVMIMAFAGIATINMETKVAEQREEIAMMQEELQAIENDNIVYSASLESMYTLDEIYNAATSELGMVYAKKGQIVYYESANEDYVKQYQEIPEAN